jgi:IclR family KDG regulon transcriptional repressor
MKKSLGKTVAMNKSLTKAVSVIKCFTPQELELGAADVARKIGIPKTTAHRILRTFADAGFLEQNVITSKYTIGPLLYMLGNLYLSTTDVLKSAEPVLKELNNLSGFDTNLGFFDKGYLTVVMRVLGKSLHRTDVRVGTIVPSHTSSMGKAFLSELSDTELDKYYPDESLPQRTRNTISSKKELKLQLEQIRKSGISYTRGEGTEDMEGIASLIRDASGKAVAAISVHLPTFKANDHLRQKLGLLIKKSCSLVSYRMGYQGKEDIVRDIRELNTWWEEQKPSESYQVASA